MAAPKGSPKHGGRGKGTPNKATSEIKALALVHAPIAIERLAYLCENATSEQAQVAACKEILDRAYGRAPQAITADDGGPVKVRFSFKLDNANSPREA